MCGIFALQATVRAYHRQDTGYADKDCRHPALRGISRSCPLLIDVRAEMQEWLTAKKIVQTVLREEEKEKQYEQEERRENAAVQQDR